MPADRPGVGRTPAAVRIGGRRVGPGEPAYIVAEMSANHGQDFARAAAIVRAAKDAGADAVKLQTYTADTLTIDSGAASFRIGSGTLWEGRTLHGLYAGASTPWEWHAPLQTLAAEIGLDLFSSPFDETAVDLLEGMNVPAYKIASFELVDLDLIDRVARTGKPVILSTGLATLAEIEEAVAAARRAGASEIVLLKCTSAYPARPEDMNLRTLTDLADRFGVPVGLSDHTVGIAAPVAAVALGASMIEKHFTLSREDATADSAFSLEPAEFRTMVQAVRDAEKALGRVHYGVTEAEMPSRVFRRSLFVVRPIRAGETFTRENVRSIRPGYGLAPKHLDRILGRRATADLARGTALAWPHVAGGGPTEEEPGAAVEGPKRG